MNARGRPPSDEDRWRMSIACDLRRLRAFGRGIAVEGGFLGLYGEWMARRLVMSWAHERARREHPANKVLAAALEGIASKVPLPDLPGATAEALRLSRTYINTAWRRLSRNAGLLVAELRSAVGESVPWGELFNSENEDLVEKAAAVDTLLGRVAQAIFDQRLSFVDACRACGVNAPEEIKRLQQLLLEMLDGDEPSDE